MGHQQRLHPRETGGVYGLTVTFESDMIAKVKKDEQAEVY